MNEVILVCGAGGFIGGHLIGEIRKTCEQPIRAVDIKPFAEWHQLHIGVENVQLDLRDSVSCEMAMRGVDCAHNLACDMGGIGFIETHKADCMLSVLINTNLLRYAMGVSRYFFASSACVYNADNQDDEKAIPLSEYMAYPAKPESGYGWEKLFSERMCMHFKEDYGIETRVARFHNVYGPHGTYKGGREKAPAAICRKIAMARITGKREIEIWGDGEQTRSFMWIGDALTGIYRITQSSNYMPINLGSSELVSINRLVDIVEEIAGIKCKRSYNMKAAQGVRGRNSDNTRIRELFDWEPSTPLKIGLEKTYAWIYDQLIK